jgi:hypothetical protein
MAAFVIGAFFWLVIGTVVTVRLMTGSVLTAAAKTGLSAYLAAPATANIAWMLSHPGPVGAVQLGLTGVLVIMALTQVVLLPEYRKLPFTQMFWLFTFPVGATANYSIRWLATTDLPAGKLRVDDSRPRNSLHVGHFSVCCDARLNYTPCQAFTTNTVRIGSRRHFYARLAKSLSCRLTDGRPRPAVVGRPTA